MYQYQYNVFTLAHSYHYDYIFAFTFGKNLIFLLIVSLFTLQTHTHFLYHMFHIWTHITFIYYFTMDLCLLYYDVRDLMLLLWNSPEIAWRHTQYGRYLYWTMTFIAFFGYDFNAFSYNILFIIYCDNLITHITFFKIIISFFLHHFTDFSGKIRTIPFFF